METQDTENQQQPFSQTELGHKSSILNNKLFKAAIGLLIIIIALTLYFLFARNDPVSQPDETKTNQSIDNTFESPSFTESVSTWDTYENSKYGFSFRHPSEISIQACEGCVDISNSDFITMQIPASLSPEEYGNLKVTNLRPVGQDESENEYLNDVSRLAGEHKRSTMLNFITINDYSGILITNKDENDNPNNKNIFLTNGKYGIFFRFDGYSSFRYSQIVNEINNRSVLEVILSTFQFPE